MALSLILIAFWLVNGQQVNDQLRDEEDSMFFAIVRVSGSKHPVMSTLDGAWIHKWDNLDKLGIAQMSTIPAFLCGKRQIYLGYQTTWTLEWPKLSVLNDNRNTFTEIEKGGGCCVTFCRDGWKLNIIFVAEVLLSSKELSGSRIWNYSSSYKFYSILPFHQITCALPLYKLILTCLITLVSCIWFTCVRGCS